jgi:hypothetical protein
MRISKGTFTLRQLILLTHRNKPNRFDYMKRDVLKKIIIKNQIELNPDRPSETNKTLEITSFSYPSYYPYLKPSSPYMRQRKIKHEYDTFLSIRVNEFGKASLDSTVWTMRLGSQKKWNYKPPQKQLKQIYSETRAKWKAKRDVDIATAKRTIRDRHQRSLAVKAAQDEYRQTIANHRAHAKYLNVSDWNSRVLGINGDAYTKVHPVLQRYGHLYGRNWYTEDVDYARPFFPKHVLRILSFLIERGILE